MKEKTLNAALLDVLNEWKSPSTRFSRHKNVQCDVSTIPLGDPTKDGWVIHVKNVPVEAVLQAARDLAEQSPSWPKNTLIKPRGPFPVQ